MEAGGKKKDHKELFLFRLGFFLSFFLQENDASRLDLAKTQIDIDGDGPRPVGPLPRRAVSSSTVQMFFLVLRARAYAWCCIAPRDRLQARAESMEPRKGNANGCYLLCVCCVHVCMQGRQAVTYQRETNRSQDSGGKRSEMPVQPATPSAGTVLPRCEWRRRLTVTARPARTATGRRRRAIMPRKARRRVCHRAGGTRPSRGRRCRRCACFRTRAWGPPPPSRPAAARRTRPPRPPRRARVWPARRGPSPGRTRAPRTPPPARAPRPRARGPPGRTGPPTARRPGAALQPGGRSARAHPWRGPPWPRNEAD
uniref:Uncharacterized protein n=1 Tax=Zea mays TaxID=4577 RepID=A0A804QLA8_MAIZE